MPNFQFTENAQAIYDKSIDATPRLFRGNTRDGLNKILMERFGEDSPIDEAAIVQVIKDNTPSAFLGRGMKAIAPLLTDPSLADL
jgi:hypothetical protein